MIDAGCSHRTIRRELGIGNAAIDGVLRRTDDGDGVPQLHP